MSSVCQQSDMMIFVGVSKRQTPNHDLRRAGLGLFLSRTAVPTHPPFLAGLTFMVLLSQWGPQEGIGTKSLWRIGTVMLGIFLGTAARLILWPDDPSVPVVANASPCFLENRLKTEKEVDIQASHRTMNRFQPSWLSPGYDTCIFQEDTMKAGKGIAVALGVLLLLCFSFGTTALAATPNLKGTWTGSGKVATNEGYQSFTVTAKISSQSGTLFRGKITVKTGTQSDTYGLIGYVAGSKVYMTLYETSGDPDSFVEGTLSANSTKITGVVRGVGAWLGYCVMTKK